MAKDSKKPTRAEEVRRRRQDSKVRRKKAAFQAASVVRPLVSRPRITGAPGSVRVQPNRGRRFEATLANTWSALALPALPSFRGNWRMVSLSILLLLVAMLGRLMTDPRMYVTEINLSGAALVPGEEIFAESGLARQHIFWVSPAAAQKRIVGVSGIAWAQVAVQWPNVVTVVVKEKVPVIKWVEGDQAWWVNAQGEKFTARGDVAGLLPITVDDAKNLGEAHIVPFPAIQGALQLRDLRPNIELLHYDAQHGLSYQDGRAWRGYFGVGTDMAQKLAVYETLVDNLLARGIHPSMVSVEDARAPYYRK
jgi:cell division septal protein FtsQ